MGRPHRNGSSFGSHMVSDTSKPSPYRTECADPRWIEVNGARGRVSQKVPCGECRHCLWTRRQSIANSVAMEVEASDWALWVTLTIAPSDEHDYATRLDKRLMQNFQKVMNIHRKRRNFSFHERNCTSYRYVQVGEFGTKGTKRAHYHALLFGKGERPVWGDNPDPDANIHIQEWPWGHINVSDRVDGGVGFYLSNYMKKNRGTPTWTSASNRYAIGAEYIVRKAIALAKVAAVPTLNWITGMPRGDKRRFALLRGAKRRVLVHSFCKAKGCSILSLARLSPEVIWPTLVRFEFERRLKEAGVPEGWIFAIQRVKAEVWTELRALVGIRETDDVKYGRAMRPHDWKAQYSFRSAGGDDGETTYLARTKGGTPREDTSGGFDEAAARWAEYEASAERAIAYNCERDRKDAAKRAEADGGRDGPEWYQRGQFA